ncbi:XdhC family protein [Nocardia sp. NPDC059091]|uniref:XdhC family protein n=1 Tax=unclassified Nocardia TaxID=2637762 RepID=UPI00367EAD77
MSTDTLRVLGPRMLGEVWTFVDDHHRAGRSVALARLVERDGPGARPLGATMAVAADGSWRGSVSGGCIEGIVLDAAREVLDTGRGRMLTLVPGEQLLPWETGPACSGELRVLVTAAPPDPVHTAITAALAHDTELTVSLGLLPPYTWCAATDRGLETTAGPALVDVISGRRRLVLAGATDLAAAIAGFAAAMQFAVVILDPRGRHLESGAFPSSAALVRGWPAEWLTANPLRPYDALIALSHDPRIDDSALRTALAGKAEYVAALGSRATHAHRLRRLAATAGLERLTGPVGLDLGGSTVAETALSILGELVASGNGRSGGPLRTGTRPIHPRPDLASA